MVSGWPRKVPEQGSDKVRGGLEEGIGGEGPHWSWEEHTGRGCGPEGGP